MTFEDLLSLTSSPKALKLLTDTSRSEYQRAADCLALLNNSTPEPAKATRKPRGPNKPKPQSDTLELTNGQDHAS